MDQARPSSECSVIHVGRLKRGGGLRSASGVGWGV